MSKTEVRVLPELVDGERLDRARFHERYEAMPPETRAELVGGVVLMPSPVSSGHGSFETGLAMWVNVYRAGVVGLRAGSNATVMLDDQAEPQPDVQLRIVSEHGGQTRIEDGYVAGAPELVIEVASSSRRIDLGPKRDDYERAGVREYLVVTIDPDEIHWFVNREGQFTRLAPGPDGLYRSEVFPGLWLDPGALFADDVEALLQAVTRGKATPEHLAFAAELAARKPS